ncbi:MAG: hypothetical protein AB7V04_07990 [Desulfomonilaceae bacterium]
MKMGQRPDSSIKFYLKQFALLSITAALIYFFTIPFLETVQTAIKYPQMVAMVNHNEEDIQSIKKEIDVAGSIEFMRAKGQTDSEAQRTLVKQLEELRLQVEMKELENKNLRDQMALVQSMLQLINSRSIPASTSPQSMDFLHKMAELSAKILGCIGSVVSGYMFVVSWWRTRKKSPDSTTA